MTVEPKVILPRPPWTGLSPREVEVLGLVSLGYEDQVIADQLILSVATVKSHVRSLIRKLGARDRTHAVTVGFMRGMLPLPANALLERVRPLLLAVPRCQVHPTVGALVGECYACTTWSRARRLEAEAGLLLIGATADV